MTRIIKIFDATTLFLIAYFFRSVSAQACPSESPTSPIPGCWGQPACAYYIAADQGLSKCTPDYCFCGGITVPLLAPTGTVTSSNCDYTTQPVSNIDLGTVAGCTADQTSVAAGSQAASTSAAITAAPSSAGSSTPAGATIVTETVSDTPLVVTYAPTKATEDVTTTTTDDSGHTGVIVIPKGQWIWSLFGPPPPGGPPPLPAPPGGVAPPVDPDTGKPDDTTDPDDPDDPDNTSTKASSASSTASSTTSSSSSSSAVSCNPADVAIASDYPFAIGDDGEELASVTISQDIIYDSMTASPSSSTAPASPASAAPSSTASSPAPSPSSTSNFLCNSGPQYKRINPDKAKSKIASLCKRYHDDKMVLSEAGESVPDDKYSDDEDIGGVAEDKADTEVNPNFALSACADGNTSTDFGAMSADDCTANFMSVLDNCPAETPNGDYTSIGGQLHADCSFWNVIAE